MKQSLCEQLLTKPGDEGAITVSISRHVKPGYEAQYELWISGVIEAASTYPGHLGTNVLRPGPTTNHEYVLIYRFDSYSNCQTWEKSSLRQAWLEKLGDMVEGDSVMRRGTGLEFWFDLPELPVQKHPSPHKMALVLITVVYSLVLMFNIMLEPLLEGMPLWQHVLVIVVLQVLLMTYLVMPRVTRLLKHWLYK
ncbi:MAG: antibiotic biosynthesis monooxygenase [Colwellia sp.]|nr:antibiotic biosynthesis monooxygenase [Colwellia sp.]MCW9080485.1 antibiotic biosynthesis monooxygenase [Colwellia sp.]